MEEEEVTSCPCALCQLICTSCRLEESQVLPYIICIWRVGLMAALMEGASCPWEGVTVNNVYVATASLGSLNS